MKVQVLIYLTHILVVYAITVPPIWPNKQNKYVFLEPKQQSRHISRPASPITHGAFKFPSFFPEDSIKAPSQDQLHLQPSNHQNIRIYHPAALKNGLQNHSPQSFQTVNFDDNNNKTPKIYIYPKTANINKPRNQRKRKLPIVHQHLTEVTAIPQNVKPAATNIHQQISRLSEESSEENEEDSKEAISEHEHPRDVPTRPIYPGEGQWAKFGLKHKPYVNRDAIKVQETAEEEERPEGVETFERGEEQFTIARNKFNNNLALFPQQHQLQTPEIVEDNERDNEPLYKKPEIDFVPQKLYTQVRRTENEEHLPRSAIEEDENAERLREVVKDSIIHTVYTEEGYEDSAYDHAGHEKNAENSEGHSESSSDQIASSERGNGGGSSKYSDEGGKRFGNNNLRKRLRNNSNTKTEDFEDNESYQNIKKKIEHQDDTEESASNHESKKINKPEIPLKEFKKVTVKNKDHEDINMEIYTEIKYTPQLKKHKYIKIIPSVIKNDVTTTEIPIKHKRVKRYDKDELSKRYIRKRPSYYWKKNRNRTRNAERNSVQNKQNDLKITLKKKPGRPTIQTSTEEEEIEIKITTPKTEQETTTTTAKTIPLNTTPYTITFPSVSKSTITTTTIHHSTSASGISPPKLVEELHPDLMNPELTTKAAKPSAPKVLPVKIKKFIKKRPKRYAIDYPKIQVDLKGFVDVEKLPNPTEKPDLTYIKYPYYNLPVSEHVNENSPVRYAEDVNNIPRKVENEMSFYESRNHIICQEVESDVNPIPAERIKNQEGDAEAPNLPRLKGLGDKIDCFKAKYFGENPLDSPFFQEDIIETPTPLFMAKEKIINKPYQNFKDKKMAATNAMYYKMRKFDTKDGDENKMQMKVYKYDNNEDGQTKKRELKIKFLEPIVVIDDDMFESATVNPIHKTTEAVLKPPYTLDEMMTMNNEKYVRFNPQNDFDQISLLEHKESNDDTKEKEDTDKFLIVYENQDVAFTKKAPEKELQLQKKSTKTENVEHDNSRFSEIISNLTSSTFNKLPEEKLSTTTSTPKPQIYTRKPYIKRATKKPITKLSIKSIKKPQIRTTTTAPESTTIQERIYQNYSPYISEIIPQPSRVVQTTTTTSEKPENNKHLESSSESSITNSTDLPENWPSLNRRLSAFYNIFDITQYFSRIPNHRIVPSEVQYKDEITPNDQIQVYDDVLKTINENKDEAESSEEEEQNKKVVKQHKNSATTTEQPEIEDYSDEAIIVQGSLPVRTTTEQNTDYSEQIAGLVPPPNSMPYQQVYQYYNEYRLNPPPSETQIAEATKNYKTFYFLGLNPPKQSKRMKRDLLEQNIKQLENDLLAEESNIDANYVGSSHRRIKRTRMKHQSYPVDDLMTAETENRPQQQRKQKVYTEIVRNRPSRPQNEEPEEEEEDLNPRKRIYELKSTTQIEEPEEQEEDLNPRKRIYELKSTRTTTQNYAELDEIAEQTETPTTREPIIFPVEANKENPHVAEYIVFVEKLKEKWAKEDATSTTTSTTEAAPKNTENRGEPAFLQIISHLHQIRKEEEAKTTTEPAIEITNAPIKNSNPFLANAGIPDSFMTELKSMQLNFDHDNTAEGSTNPEVSRTRNYINRFKTSIDTSKYKTIERNPVSLRHNFSSRYNAEDEELPLKRGQTTQTPMIIAIISNSELSSTTTNPEETDIIAEVITERILKESTPQSSTTTTTTTEADTTTATTTTTTIGTTRSRQRGRGRTRPTITTTIRPATTLTSNPLFRRRRPTRITTTTTTTQSPGNSSSIQFRRRNRLKAAETRNLLTNIPSNHRVTFNPISEETTTEQPVVVVTPVPPNNEEPKKQRRFQKVQERRVTSEVTLTRYFEPLSGESEESAEQEESKKHQYEVIGPLTHTDKGHGGNYRHINDKSSDEEEEETDIATPPESFYSDPNLAENINLLKDAEQGTTVSAKTQASNNLFTNEEIAEKVAVKPSHSKVSLYPNMARMVNRLADSQTNNQEGSIDEAANEKPTFIKDPSRRMYYYAKL